MARTKASVGAKVSSGKSSKARCSAAPPSNSYGASGSSDRGSKSTGGGNSVCPRETPKWQRPITNFFIEAIGKEKTENGDNGAGTSRSKPRRNIIESSDEEELQQTPKNQELDETIHLEPLTGEKSHKIEEYYPKNGVKGKGVGKKTNKENIDSNNENRKSVKRDFEEDLLSETQVKKKVKV